MKQLVKLKRRSSRNGEMFSYFPDYVDENGKAIPMFSCRLYIMNTFKDGVNKANKLCQTQD